MIAVLSGQNWDVTFMDWAIMEERAFQAMLERYPVVRKKTYCRIEWNKSEAPQSTLTTSKTSSFSNVEPMNSSDTFPVMTEHFLQQFYTESESKAIVRHLKTTIDAFVGNLCLEDLNDLCSLL